MFYLLYFTFKAGDIVSVQNFNNKEINYIYLECPKKEYYFISNLTDSHEYDYIKPIGESLVEFLNVDLEGYEERLKNLYEIVYKTEITSMLELVIPFMEFMDLYVSKCGVFFLDYVYIPIKNAFDELVMYAQKNIPIYLPKKVYREWYCWLKEYSMLNKRYRKFIDYIFNLKRNRFEDLNKAILKSYNDFPDISRTNLSRTLTSAPMKDGKFDLDYIKEINDLDISVINKSDMVYAESADFKPLYAIQIHSLNEALFYEFSELVKNGYRINRCKMCGKYFLAITARNVEYCKNKNESGYSCAKLASATKYKESLSDTFLKEYAKINEKMYQRYYRVKDASRNEELSGKDMTFSEYDEWSQKAQKIRKDYINNRDAISKNLNLSSKQKYSKKQSLGEKFIADIKAIPYPEKSGKRKSKGIVME